MKIVAPAGIAPSSRLNHPQMNPNILPFSAWALHCRCPGVVVECLMSNSLKSSLFSFFYKFCPIVWMKLHWQGKMTDPIYENFHCHCFLVLAWNCNSLCVFCEGVCHNQNHFVTLRSWVDPQLVMVVMESVLHLISNLLGIASMSQCVVECLSSYLAKNKHQ